MFSRHVYSGNDRSPLRSIINDVQRLIDSDDTADPRIRPAGIRSGSF